MWVDDPSSDLPDGNEFEVCVEKMDRSLEKWLKSQKQRVGSCYYRWDFFGDRTQYLEVNDIQLLDEQLIVYVQLELKKKWANWRVAIPTPGAPGEAIMVYPYVVRIWREGTAPLSQLLQSIRTKMH